MITLPIYVSYKEIHRRNDRKAATRTDFSEAKEQL
jgi:hypothetical protein